MDISQISYLRVKFIAKQGTLLQIAFTEMNNNLHLLVEFQNVKSVEKEITLLSAGLTGATVHFKVLNYLHYSLSWLLILQLISILIKPG